MKKLAVFCITIFCLSLWFYNATSATAQKQMPNDTIEWNNHYYKYYSNDLNWYEAKQYCEELGGHLVSITSKEENNFIFKRIIKKVNKNVMIGLSDAHEEGTWEWVTGEPFNYSNWSSGEPNNEFNEDYVLMNSDNGKWNDGHLERENWNFICEWDKEKPKLSKEVLNLSLAGEKVYNLKLINEKIHGTIKWKSSNKNVATVNKKGKVTAKNVGKTQITAEANGMVATCEVTVKDYAYKTISYNFDTFDTWKTLVNQKERELVFGGRIVPADASGSTFYTGTLIMDKKVLAFKTVNVRVSLNTPGSYRTIKIKLPSKIKYKLHKHSMKQGYGASWYLSSDSMVLVQRCSCGYHSKWNWEIPLDDGKGGNQNTDTVIKALPKVNKYIGKSSSY